MKTIYEIAKIAMDLEIKRYLKLIKDSKGFDDLKEIHLTDTPTASLFAKGIDSRIPNNCDNIPAFLVSEYQRKAAIAFDIENAISLGVYQKIKSYTKQLYDIATQITIGFTEFIPENLKKNPYLIPVFQSVLKLSKSQLQKKVGSISDQSISAPASIRLAAILKTIVSPSDYEETNVLLRMEITLEGIVRDLVGKVLFEEIVSNALDEQGVTFKRESEYPSINGVVYDFRADFVIPDSINPLAFIEVRKSSSRHASLYAKEKMFSAINWKGQHHNLIGVIIVEGEWTQTTLRTMAKVFDYVIPLAKSVDLAKLLKKAQDGDESILKWLIQFKISESPSFNKQNKIEI